MVPKKRGAQDVEPEEGNVNGFPFEQRKHKKYRKDKSSQQNHQNLGPAASITSATQLRKLLADYNDGAKILHGVHSFKEFLKAYRSPEETEEGRASKLYIISEYLNGQTGGREGDEAWNDLLQAWSFGSQSNNTLLLSWIPTVLEQLFIIITPVLTLKKQGLALARAILDTSYMKTFYRALTHGGDPVSAPCLRLLTQINQFDDGSLCPSLFQIFDFTVKDIGKKLELKSANEKAAPLQESPDRPSVRTVYVRFILSFLKNGPATVKAGVLGIRNLTLPFFRHLRTDTSAVVKEVLDILLEVVANKDIPKAAKSAFFNEWALVRIADLYRREDSVEENGKEVDISAICHRFLLSVCTTPGNGICFQDSGWFSTQPFTVTAAASASALPSSEKKSEEHRPSNKQVHNRALSNFILELRPHAQELHLDLIIAIFKVCPELVSKYFKDTQSFTFDPKLTMTWMGFSTLLSEVLQLPVERGFNPPRIDQKAPLLPPSASTILDNILPKPLTRVVTTKCLAHDSYLVRFLTTQLLNLSFSALSAALECLDHGASQVVDPIAWENVRFALVEEFCKIIPDMDPVIKAFKTAPEDGQLYREAITKLLKNYYRCVPEISSGQSFDLTTILTTALDNSGEYSTGLNVIVLQNLLSIAEELPDIKWWNKSPTSKYSPFVSVLKFTVDSGVTSDTHDVNAILTAFTKSSYLFQPETVISPLDALLQSLQVCKNDSHFEHILQYLDNCALRCVQKPFKYVDDYAELALDAARKKGLRNSKGGTRVYVKPVSPLLMALVEQWKFLLGNDKVHLAGKSAVEKWLVYFIEGCYFLGENPDVLKGLAERLISGDFESANAKLLCNALERWESRTVILSKSNPENILSSTIRQWIGCGASLNSNFARQNNLISRVGGLSYLDLAVLCQTAAIVTLSESQTENSSAIIETLWATFKAEFEAILRSKSKETDSKMKLFLTEIVRDFSFLYGSSNCNTIAESQKRLPLDLALAECMSMFATSDGLPLVTSDRLLNYYVTVCSQITSETSEVFQHLITLCVSNLLTSDGLETLIDRSAYLPNNALRSAALEAAVSALMSKEGMLTNTSVRSIILHFRELPDSVYEILNDNLLVDEEFADLLYKNSAVIRKLFFGRKMQTDLACKIMSLVPALLPDCQQWIKETGNSERHVAQFTLVALRQYTVFDDESLKFVWKSNVDEKVKSGLQEDMKMLQTTLDSDVSAFLAEKDSLLMLEMAAYVLSSVDKDLFLKGLIKRSKGLNTVEVLRCLESFFANNVDRKSFAEALTESVRSLINQISDPAALGAELVGYAQELGQFIIRRRLEVSSFLPRSILNALLEAILTVKIDVPELGYLVAAIISQCSAKDLDHSKFLQLMLSHNKSPLSKTALEDESERLPRLYLAFAVDKLFSFKKAGHSSITTLDGVLSSYRGTCDPVDKVLLSIIDFIEGHLSWSCAARITQWKISEKSAGGALVSRDGRNHLRISFDPVMIKRSIWKVHPNSSIRPQQQSQTLEDFIKLCEKAKQDDWNQTYDLRFFIAAVTYCLLHAPQEVDVQSLVEKNCVGLAIMGLASEDADVRSMAEAFLGALIAKLESSSYRERTQVQHLLSALLASLDGSTVDIKSQPLPTVITVFLSNCVSILTQPTHFLYEKVMNMLLRKPYLEFNDISILNSLLFSDGEYQKELNWILRILSAGLKTEKDLTIYSKKKTFEIAQSLYVASTTNSNAKEKIMEILWATADVEGGATTLITRNGTLSWIQGLVVGMRDGAEKLLLKRLAARLYEGSAKEHVREWSGGGIYFLLEAIMKA